jgi:hypothetical protein
MVSVSLCSQNGPPPPPKPFEKPWFMCQHIVTAQFFQWVMLFEAQLAFIYCLPCSSLCIEILTLAYETQKLLTRKVVSGVLYLYTSNKTNVQKSEISTKIDVYSYRRAHSHASCSAGVMCRCSVVVTCNTQPSIYWKCFGDPRIAGILYDSHIIAWDLFCCHCKQRSYHTGVRFLKLCQSYRVN